MKKPRHKILWIGSTVIVLAIFVPSIIYWRISTEWRNYYSEDEMRALAEEISKASELQPVFYGIHDALYNSDRHRSVINTKGRRFFYDLLGRSLDETSWHELAAYYTMTKGMGRFGRAKSALALSNFVTSEKCFDYVMQRDYEYVSEMGYEFVPPAEMTDTLEILKFIAVAKGPAYFKDETKLNYRIEQLRERLELMKKEKLWK